MVHISYIRAGFEKIAEGSVGMKILGYMLKNPTVPLAVVGLGAIGAGVSRAITRNIGPMYMMNEHSKGKEMGEQTQYLQQIANSVQKAPDPYQQPVLVQPLA